jgi:hypothetical protein
MQPHEPAGFLSTYHVAGLTQNGVRHQSPAHADAAVNGPHCQLDPHPRHRLAPREHMLIHAVDQRPVEIEQERRPSRRKIAR